MQLRPTTPGHHMLGLVPRDKSLEFLRRLSPLLLRVSLALTFIWFGGLKVAGLTPVAALVADTVSWVPGLSASWFVPALGAVEVALGVALLCNRARGVVLGALIVHLTGTFLVLVVQPHVAFQNGNPLLLTTEGEFVVKNVVLISGLLVLAAQSQDEHHGSLAPDRGLSSRDGPQPSPRR